MWTYEDVEGRRSGWLDAGRQGGRAGPADWHGVPTPLSLIFMQES